MKKMAVALSSLLCLFLFAGCGKSTPIQGTWMDDAGNVYRFEKDLTFSIDTGDEITEMSIRDRFTCLRTYCRKLAIDVVFPVFICCLLWQ